MSYSVLKSFLAKKRQNNCPYNKKTAIKRFFIFYYNCFVARTYFYSAHAEHRP